MSGPELDLCGATVASLHAGYGSGACTVEAVVRGYLRRIEAYDRAGPRLNAVITVNPDAGAEARRCDEVLRDGGRRGPLHGVPVILKDQVDVVGMPTTLGSVLFEGYRPDQDASVVRRLKDAGAVVLAKATLGELGAGDTHGSLFGSTRNPYDPARTVGGSSGGPAACMAADFATLAVGQEGLSSISRPAAWNCVVGMRPTAGVVSRTGAFGGWPSRAGSLGPITRTVEDAARLLDVMAGYDVEDPLTAHGVRRVPASFLDGLHLGALEGVRVGVLREDMGLGSEPGSEDHQQVMAVYDRAVAELRAAGATTVDPVVIPQLRDLLAQRAFEHAPEAFERWMARSAAPPFASYEELVRHPAYGRAVGARTGHRPPGFVASHYDYLLAQRQLRDNLLAVMAEHDLDVLVHRSVEHTPTTIAEGTGPPYTNQKGAVHLNTFLVDVPSISVPAGFSSSRLPVGLSFLGRPFADADVLAYAYAYERSTGHRTPPATTPPLT